MRPPPLRRASSASVAQAELAKASWKPGRNGKRARSRDADRADHAEGREGTAEEHELDVLVYATGFDAITGEMTRMNIRGEGGRTMKETWADGPRTYLGLQTAGFPNLFVANGAVFGNVPPCSETVVEWVGDTIAHMREHGFTRISTTPEAEAAWIRHNDELVSSFPVLTDANSWFVGANIPGKKRAFLFYAGGNSGFRQKCREVVQKGYEGFVME